MAEQQSGFRRILTSMQNTVQGRTALPPGTTALQNQASTKEGWLKKQGGIVKSWHMRWFTIKGDQLFYFANNDESKPPLGVIFLPGNRVVDMPNNPNEPDKFLFEIGPGGDRNRMTVTHETYPICAGSEDERKAWVHAIKKVMYYDKGGAIFGLPLDETMAYENLTSKRKVPQIVEMCVEYVIENGLEIEGIFRLPGRSSLIKRLREEFDCGERPAFSLPEIDVHSVASLLKLFLRELPAPLIPVSFYERVMKIVTRDFHQNPDASLDNLAQVLREIPRHNYNLLQYLSHFLLEVSSKSDINRMSIMNLATVFVQNNIIQPELDDAALLMGTSNGRTQVAFLLITNYDKLFKMDYNAQGVSVQVDNLLDLDGASDTTFKVETTLPESASDLLGIDLSSGLPSPIAPDVPEKSYSGEAQDGLSGEVEVDGGAVSSPDVETDGMDDVLAGADGVEDRVAQAVGDECPSPGAESSSLSPSQSSFTEVTADIPSDMSWSCSSYDVGSSFPNTPSASYPGTPSSETHPQQMSQPQPPPRPPRPMPRSRSSQEMSRAQIDVDPASSLPPAGPVPPARPPAPESSTQPARPVRPAPAPPQPQPRGIARASLSSSSVSTESVDTVDSGHVDTEEEERDDDKLDRLLLVSLQGMGSDELVNHVESLREELRNQRARNHSLQASKSALKEKHKGQILDMAKKLDLEKTATANAVQRCMELQQKMQRLELKHGNLV